MPLNTLVDACRTLAREKNEFLSLAILSDWSFEEGTRNSDFRRCVDAYEHAGLPRRLVEALHKGINGNLAEIIETSPLVCGPVQRNQARGRQIPDIEFNTSEGSALVEVKMIWDMTLPKYFADVAHDATKWRYEIGGGRALQVVFFFELPNYEYPSGTSNRGERWNSRSTYVKSPRLIRRQYEKLMGLMRNPPVWPESPPWIQPLAPPESFGGPLMEKWFERLFTPDDPGWRFDPERTFHEASVGVAIWDH